jgi:hypothetical protein
MKYTVHRYSLLSRILFWTFNLMGLYLIIGSLYVLIMPLFENMFDVILVFTLLFGLGLVTIFCANLYPDIVIDHEGLLIRFSFWRLRVRWENVLGIKKEKIASFLSRTSYYIVQTKALTPLHRFYGLYAWSFQPSFLIASDITDFQLLLDRIQNRRFDTTNIEEVVKA